MEKIQKKLEYTKIFRHINFYVKSRQGDAVWKSKADAVIYDTADEIILKSQ